MRRIIGIAVVAWLVAGLVAPVLAGGLADLSAALQEVTASGELTDTGLKATLDTILADALAAPDAQAELAYRGTFIDLLRAYSGAGITETAATRLITLAAGSTLDI